MSEVNFSDKYRISMLIAKIYFFMTVQKVNCGWGINGKDGKKQLIKIAKNQVMKNQLAEYSSEERAKYDAMHTVIGHYNESVRAGQELPKPIYSDHDLSEYSRYRTILLYAGIKSELNPE